MICPVSTKCHIALVNPLVSACFEVTDVRKVSLCNRVLTRSKGAVTTLPAMPPRPPARKWTLEIPRLGSTMVCTGVAAVDREATVAASVGVGGLSAMEKLQRRASCQLGSSW
jgi:uncharacterized protein (UPF0261 family)